MHRRVKRHYLLFASFSSKMQKFYQMKKFCLRENVLSRKQKDICMSTYRTEHSFNGSGRNALQGPGNIYWEQKRKTVRMAYPL